MKQFNNFTEGDCICGENASPEELKRWTGDQYDLAKAELAKYSCSYRKSGGYMFADEYALEYCNMDEDGEFPGRIVPRSSGERSMKEKKNYKKCVICGKEILALPPATL